MSGKKQKAVTPRLRFPEFRDAGAWDEKRLGEISGRIVEKVGDSKLVPVSISAGIGFVSQVSRFGRNISGKQYKNYIRLRCGEFAYNKGNSKKYPQGCIYKLCEYEQVAAPNAFICFRFDEAYIGGFYQHFFEANYHANQLRKYITSGARSDGLLNINPNDFFSIKIPAPKRDEQQKIADFLSSLDELIRLHGQKLDALKAHKKGLMQQLFPQPGQTQPRLRFPEFRDKGEWEVQSFEALYDFKPNNNYSRDQLNYDEGTVKNIHYGDIHKRFSTHFHINAEEVPFVNAEVLPNELNHDSLCRPGDVIFADASEDLADVGKCIEIIDVTDERVLSGSHTILARPRTTTIVVGFGGYLFKSRSARAGIEKEAQGTKVVQISPKRLATIKVFFPPDEQEQQCITGCLTALDARIAAQAAKIDALRTHKRGLMQQLFPTPEEP